MSVRRHVSFHSFMEFPTVFKYDTYYGAFVVPFEIALYCLFYQILLYILLLLQIWSQPVIYDVQEKEEKGSSPPVYQVIKKNASAPTPCKAMAPGCISLC
ncbi:hypothetical protein KIN20_023609 [Parelaphostrongylus tenuis]|uniref:Uncharacterized protein n=1 Tax=Parelaphostrongylus tenuis TaxID=148309 RepID=A0AAD5NA94_PARTN|nr:hypothetical protein KIN20_023609 [Parelaphostrongylus tenuis]